MCDRCNLDPLETGYIHFPKIGEKMPEPAGWDINTNFERVKTIRVTTKEELKHHVTEFALRMTKVTDEIIITPFFE